MLAALGALLRPALSYVLPLFWVLAACTAACIGMFTWSTIAGWIAVAVSCLVVEFRADIEQRIKPAARRG
ncbi:hypothetical protein [Amycolatopsis sp. NPDC004378]